MATKESREGAKYQAQSRPAHTDVSHSKPYPPKVSAAPKAAFPEGRPQPTYTPSITLRQLQRRVVQAGPKGGGGHGGHRGGSGGDNDRAGLVQSAEGKERGPSAKERRWHAAVGRGQTQGKHRGMGGGGGGKGHSKGHEKDSRQEQAHWSRGPGAGKGPEGRGGGGNTGRGGLGGRGPRAEGNGKGKGRLPQGKECGAAPRLGVQVVRCITPGI